MTALPTTQAGRLDRPDGASIAYEVTGTGPALVFAHGMGGNLLSWWQQIPFFAGNYTCITISQRSFGGSTYPASGPKLADFPGDVVALLDHLKIRKVVFIGQSMGGWTGVELTLAHPDRVAGLVLSNTTGTLDYERYGDDRVAAWRDRLPAKQAELAAAGVHRATSLVFARERPALHSLYGAIERMNDSSQREVLFKQLGALRNRGPEDAKRITCPVMCVTGEHDIAICPAGVHAVAKQLPDARVFEVPATGHSVYFERAALFNAKLKEFLDEIGWR
jgi:3-oxoadipate enol-lactonase